MTASGTQTDEMKVSADNKIPRLMVETTGALQPMTVTEITACA